MDDLQRLVAIEAIKQLKARYQRCLDTKDWAGLADCFSEDATSEYDGGKYSFHPRDAIIEFLSTSMAKLVTLHQVHTPEIDVLSETEAHGIWYLQDIVFAEDREMTLLGAGFYHDVCVKRGGAWLIHKIGYERTFERWESHADAKRRKLEHRWDF